MKNMNGAKRCPAVAVAAVILGMGFCMAAQAQSYDDNYDYSPSYGHRIVDRSLARDPDNGIRTLKAGQAAQERRFAARADGLDQRTRALVNGRTPEAQMLRERGHVARNARTYPRRMQVLQHRYPGTAPATPRARVSVPHTRVRVSTRYARTARAAAKGAAVSAIGVTAAGWALGVRPPDAIDAAKWTAGTLARPQDTPKRVVNLGRGAVRMTGTAMRSVTHPARMVKNFSCGLSQTFGGKCRHRR